ncbi:protein ACCELERATED CELL DEATH 6-like [Quercus lobata]|uniref:protein ACCELERATED CELL DEATH 6-like n=1 Tax=Quercus lobata TaxID=97700 RepID=UPI001243DDA2|nr:protein ACCELERATED CELL DEATH 6-like [Quercus lobata]
MEVSSMPTKDGSIAEWDYDSILTKLRDTECSLLLERFFDSNTLLHVAASLGHDQTVEAILSKQQCQQQLLTATNSNGDLPLHVAANAGHLSIVQQLVEPSHQCQELLMAKNSNGDHPVHVAANAGHLSVVQYLFSFSYEYQEQLKSENSESCDDPGSVESNIQQQLNDLTSKLLREKNNEGNTPLHLALINKYEEMDVKCKYNEVAEFLIKEDPSVCNYRNKASKNPRRLAKEAKDEDISKLISGKSPPRYAGFGTAKTLKGVRHNCKSKNRARSRTFCSLSLCDKTPESTIRLQTLSSASSAPEMITQRRPIGKPPKIVPSKRKSKDKVTSMDGELYKAVKCRDINFIRTQNPEHSALSDRTPELNTILHLAAASSGDHRFVESILKIPPCQKFVTEKNSNGDLPLHVAASAGNIHMVEHLVKWSDEHLKDPSNCVPLVEKNMEENTPLHLALIKKVAKFLVEKCPEVSFYPNKERKSPLYLAAEGGDKELVKHMITTNRLAHGKSIVHAALYYLTTIDLPYGRSIVHTAIYGSFTARKLRCLNTHAASFLCPSMCLNTNTDILDTVLKSLPDDILKEKDDKGMTPLFYAASIGYLDGVEILLEKPTCCAYERDTDGYYPIHIASKKGHIQVIKKFLDKYPDMIELLNEEGQNILHVAAMYGKVKVVTYMLKRHDLNVEMLINNKDQNGNTPLHLATMEGHPRVVWHLTGDKRVDLKALNKEGKRALDIALNDSKEDPHLERYQLTWEALRYVSGPTETPQSPKVGKTLSADKYKERTETLSLVATLVATVTFAAAFTMPGGYNGPGGMATFLEKPMFQAFVISNTVAMYSAITAVIALIWAHLGGLKLFIAAYKFSLPILGLAITMASLAFMAGNYLVLRDLNWLAYLVLSIGSFFYFTLSTIFFLLFFPNSSPNPIIRYLLRYPFYLLIMVTS